MQQLEHIRQKAASGPASWAYNNLKLEDVSAEDQVCKKWEWILAVVKRFSGIYANNPRTAERYRSEANIRALLYEMHRVGGYPKFNY